jgi:Trp repressor protein
MLNTMLTPTPIPIPPRPKSGPIGTWEELAQHQLRLQLMVFMLCKSMSYRAIARELGVARTTVMRMAPEAARFSAYTDCFVNIPLPVTRSGTNGSEPAVGLTCSDGVTRRSG